MTDDELLYKLCKYINISALIHQRVTQPLFSPHIAFFNILLIYGLILQCTINNDIHNNCYINLLTMSALQCI